MCAKGAVPIITSPMMDAGASLSQALMCEGGRRVWGGGGVLRWRAGQLARQGGEPLERGTIGKGAQEGKGRQAKGNTLVLEVLVPTAQLCKSGLLEPHAPVCADAPAPGRTGARRTAHRIPHVAQHRGGGAVWRRGG